MKKISLFLFAATAMIFAASCNKGIDLGNDSKAELTINSVALTKGYVEGADFLSTPFDKLHPTTGAVDRKLWMSAYLTPQSGASENYFVNQEFSKDTDGLWHHDPKVYWPLGGTLDFLAYSANEQISGTALNWDPVNAASKLVLNVSNEFLQDDLLYGAVNGRTTNNGASVEMIFKHTQAWIQFQIKVKEASMENIFKLRDITIGNLYTRGELTINGGATPTHTWNFKNETAANYKMHDTYKICDDPEAVTPKYIGAAVAYMDMLVPEQDQTKFIMHYVLEGQDNVLEYKYDLSDTWVAGKKYIYEIEISPYEITVTPSVTPFANVNPGATGFPSPLE